jgi:hypothetical protein
MAPQHVALWTQWMTDYMASTLGSAEPHLQRGRAPCSDQERALGMVRAHCF